MMIVCNTCGAVFEEPVVVKAVYHEDDDLYENFYGCPHCYLDNFEFIERNENDDIH